MILILYLIGLIFLILLPALIFFYLFGDFVMHFLGAPFVPTSRKEMKEILKKAKLKKGQVFIELGSGDGRVVMQACQEFGVSGVGIEGHPLLWLFSKLMSKVNKVKNVTFLRKNFFNSNLRQADVIYLFLFPKTLVNLKNKFLKECKKNTLLISHGFKIQGFENLLIGKIERKVYNTYFYKLP